MQLTLQDVGVAIGGRDLFSPVSFALSEGDSLAVMGPSGVGKSTLLSVIAGFSEPTKGVVSVEGARSAQPFEFLIQLAPLLVRRSVLDNVCLAQRIRNSDTGALVDEAMVLLTRLGLERHAASSVYALSGGERQRVAAARAALNRPDILLADEPTASLDVWSRDAVMDVLLDCVGARGIVVVATHDPAVAERCASVLVLDASEAERA